jgi:hypothetical protein
VVKFPSNKFHGDPISGPVVIVSVQTAARENSKQGTRKSFNARFPMQQAIPSLAQKAMNLRREHQFAVKSVLDRGAGCTHARGV